MGGEHPPNPPRYDADGSGRDTYIRRDPTGCYGKTLYKSEPRIPTRFGAAGSVLTRDRHTGYCGYTLGAPGTAEYDEGYGGRVGGESGGGLKVVQARYLMPVPPAFEVEVCPAPCTVRRAPCAMHRIHTRGYLCSISACTHVSACADTHAHATHVPGACLAGRLLLAYYSHR